jgi:P-type conjugative transfer protein TrbJ
MGVVMFKIRKNLLLATVCGFLALGGGQYAAASGIPVYDVSNLAQNLLTAQRSLEQINNQLKMLESLDFDSSGDVANILNETNSVLNQVEGIAYSVGQISEEYANAYPEDMNGMSYEDLGSLKDSILQQTRSAQEHAMELQASVAGSIPQTRMTVDEIVSRSNAAPGTTAAVQANTQMLATLSAQMSQMQALLMSQTRALNTYIQEQNSRALVAQERRTMMFEGIEHVEPRTDNYNPLDY